MRYLRMYIVINVLMTGVMRASDTTPIESISTGVDEEPPQQVQEEISDLYGSGTVSLPAQDVLDEQSFDNQEIKTDQPVAELRAPVDHEPTIEDAEALNQEPVLVSSSGSSLIPSLPIQPGMTLGDLPKEPKSHDVVLSLQPEDEPIKGIDTVDLEQPQGNWLFKRYWWDRAAEVSKKMHAYLEKINDIRVKFFARRTELDKVILDPFYTDIGLSQAELQKSMQALMTQLEQEREKQGMLSDEERELMERVQKDRERLQQLDRDVRAVGSLREAADNTVDRVMDQKNRVAQYEKESRETVQEIGRIVSDTQASELYYRMDAAWHTVKDVYQYIDQDLNRYFDKLLLHAREQTDRIKLALQALKEQGVDLKARVQEAQDHDLAKELAVEEDKEKDKKAVEPQKTGWFASGSRLFQAAIDVALWQFLQSIWDVVMWLPRRMYGTITSIFR